MIEMKCPFCNSEIEQLNDQQRSLFHCSNIVCCKGGHYIGNISMWRDLIRTRKENEDKQAVLNCVVDMLKTLNQRYALIMGKDVIKEMVRLLEQTKGGDNE